MWKTSAVNALEREVRLAMALAMTEREARFNEAAKRYHGKQYDDLEEWTEKACAGLYQRKPKINARVTRLAVGTVNDYLFGAGNGPTFAVVDDLDDEQRLGLNEPGSDLDARVSELHRTSGLASLQVEIGRLGLQNGTVAVGFHYLRSPGETRGRFVCEIIAVARSVETLARDDLEAAIKYGLDLDELARLDEQWRTLRRDPETGREAEYLHRRVWTPERIDVYKPINLEGVADPDELTWSIDTTTEHGFGFVPVVWIPNGSMIAHDSEGEPLVGEAEYTLEDDVNYTLSQASRGVSYNQEPTLVFTNVSGADAGGTIERGGSATLTVSPDLASTQNADAKLLELNGTGQRVAHDHARLVWNMFFQLCRVVIHDPQNFAGALSGVALERLLQPTLQVVRGVRAGYGDGLARLLSYMLRVEGAPRDVQVVAGWPRLVEPTVAEIEAGVRGLTAARLEGLLAERDAVRLAAALFGVDERAALAALEGTTTTSGTAAIEEPPANITTPPDGEDADLDGLA